MRARHVALVDLSFFSPIKASVDSQGPSGLIIARPCVLRCFEHFGANKTTAT